jgi:hypothetical protein
MTLPVTKDDIEAARSRNNGSTGLDVMLARIGASRGRRYGRYVRLRNWSMWVIADESLHDEWLPHHGPWDAVLLPDPLRPAMELVDTPVPFGGTLRSYTEVWR